MPAPHVARTGRSTVRRKPNRGHYDRATIHAILDEALICHVGFALGGRPWTVPTAFARIGDYLYLHGAARNFALRALAGGAEGCVTVTLIDGLVLARSAFNHSINYRSVMLFGRAEAVEDGEEKERVLVALVDHMVPGRSMATRLPTREELRATLVVRFPIEEGSAKVRTGGPIDEPGDYALPYWAGVIPVTLLRGEPQPDIASQPRAPREGDA